MQVLVTLCFKSIVTLVFNSGTQANSDFQRFPAAIFKIGLDLGFTN